MKRALLLLIFIPAVLFTARAQDIPLFVQKMTNSFLYNPAVAGHNGGSFAYSFKKNYSQIQNAPRANFLSLHTPVANNSFGFGVNVFQEDVNFLRNTFASVAFAYHVKMTPSNVLSFGLSGEYNMMRLNGRTNSNIEDPDYQKLSSGDLNDMDFSFGMMYHSRFMKFGFSANRLASAWIKPEEKFLVTNYYTAMAQGMIPVRGGEDNLEPYVAYRKLSETNNTVDLGLYYTYNDMFTLGGAWRSGSATTASAAFRLNKTFMLGYSHEIYLGEFRGQLGSSSEITLRLDFKEYSYKTNFRADYKNAVAYRRKTLSGSAARTPFQLHNQQKRITSQSPNKRYQMNPAQFRKQQGLNKKKIKKSKRYNPRRR